MVIHDCQQYTPEYWSLRCGMITASELHRIMTPAKWQLAAGRESYACELVAQRFDYDYGKPTEFATAAMRNGLIIEPEARRYYELQRGADVEQVGFVTTDDGRFGCSPDGLVGEDGGLELKHPTASTHVAWLKRGVVPPEHVAQCYGSIIVTRRQWWDFCSYYPGMRPLLIRVEPDEKLLKLAEAMEQFYRELCELRELIEGGRQEIIAAAIAAAEPQPAYF